MTPVQTKIRKTSRYISIALKIAELFVITGAVLTAAGLVIILCNLSNLSSFLVNAGEIADVQVAAVLMPVLLGVLAAAMAVNGVGCHQLYRIFKDVSREASPFAAKHVRRIKTVAWLSVPMAVLDGTIPNLSEALRTGDSMIVVGIEAMWIIFGAILYCLALIFDYGCQLQQESDETL